MTFFASNILFTGTYFVQLIQIFSRYNIEKHANDRHSRKGVFLKLCGEHDFSKLNHLKSKI